MRETYSDGCIQWTPTEFDVSIIYTPHGCGRQRHFCRKDVVECRQGWAMRYGLGQYNIISNITTSSHKQQFIIVTLKMLH